MEIAVVLNRQHQRVVAPRDDAPRWPEGYIEVLREAGAQERAIPYCLTWVRSFFARYPGRKRRDLGRPEIEGFLSELARRAGVSNWQVAQARGALEIYYERFRGIPLAARPDQPTGTARASASPPPCVEDPGVSLRAASSTSDDVPAYAGAREGGKGVVRGAALIRPSGKPLPREARRGGIRRRGALMGRGP